MSSSSLCYDIEGNASPCSDVLAAQGGSGDVSYISGSVPSDVLNTSNPVSTMAGSSSGGSALSSILGSVLNFGSSVIRTVNSPSTSSSGLQYKLNPATGQYGYYNTATGTWSASPNTTGLSGFFGGSGSFILLILAVIIGFLAFGKKR
jgi:hypothetical protein